MSIESVTPSSHLILCRPLLLLLPIPPSIRVFSNESTLRTRWPKYWSFSFSISPSKDPGLISFRMDWLDVPAVQGTLKSLLEHRSLKARNKLDFPNSPLPHSLLCPSQVRYTLYKNDPPPPITSVGAFICYFSEKIGAIIQQLLNCSPSKLTNLSVYTCSFILLIFLPLFWILFPLTFSGSLPNFIFFLFWIAKVSPIFFFFFF